MLRGTGSGTKTTCSTGAVGLAMDDNKRPTPTSAIRLMSWRTVVRSNSSHADMPMSSNPTMLVSSGTRRPRERAAFMAPIATTSFPQMTQVGGVGADAKWRKPR